MDDRMVKSVNADVDGAELRGRIIAHLAKVRSDLSAMVFDPALASALPTVDEVLDERSRPANKPSHHCAGGRCRMVAATDGWLAVHLARDQDLESVPAVITSPEGSNGADESSPEASSIDPWKMLDGWAASLSAEAAVQRLALFDVPAAVVGQSPPGEGTRVNSLGNEPAGPRRRVSPPRVIDTTALWAGPLTARLLGDLGAEVVGDPHPTRPDPTEGTDPEHFRRLHQHHQEASVDPASPERRQELEEQFAKSDVVLFNARARALSELGLGPSELCRRHPHLLVVTLTAYGFSGAWSGRPGLGDDVGASAGLVSAPNHPGGPPGFIGDAIADPITGFTAARDTARALTRGQVGHLDVSMRSASAAVLA